MSILQILLFLFSASAIWLLSSDQPWSDRWGFLVGLAGQPFWIAETYAAEQYAMLTLSLFYTLAWAKGVRKHWFRRAGA